MEEKKKSFWAIVWMVLAGVVGFLLYVFFNRDPKDKPVKNFTVKDDKTITTSEGVDVVLPDGIKSSDVVSAQTKVEMAPVAEDKISVHVRKASPNTPPASEEKSAGEMMFGPKA